MMEDSLKGSIYDCSGPFEFNDNIDDEEYY